MPEFKDILTGIFVVCMLFFMVPIKIDYPGRTKASFETYVRKFNKTYTKNNTEYESRYKNFQESLLRIDQMNSMNSGKAQFGLTEFSDMSKEEFLKYRLGLRPSSAKRSRRKHKKHHEGYVHIDKHERFERAAVSVDIPATLDWREQGVVSAVRDQGLCGACWAHSTVAAVESRLAILNGSLTELSVEQMIDCAGLGNYGCAGGDICSLLVWLSIFKVPVLPQSVYKGSANRACTLDPNTKATNESITIKEYTCTDLSKQEKMIIQMLVTRGPLAVAVNALPWQHYLGGVIQYHCSGDPDDLNHAVQIVGYDLTAPVPYYIARNSWGTNFGDAGYVKMAIGSNVCGLANEVAAVDVNY